MDTTGLSFNMMLRFSAAVSDEISYDLLVERASSGGPGTTGDFALALAISHASFALHTGGFEREQSGAWETPAADGKRWFANAQALTVIGTTSLRPRCIGGKLFVDADLLRSIVSSRAQCKL
jgi:hypothetical protein